MLGAPGVGKGTQGRRLAASCGLPLISTGEMLREAVARGTALGREAGRQMEAGQLVDDGVMIGLVRERTAEPDARGGFVLDGFPRTVPQAEALDAMLAERGQRIDVVLSLTVEEDELVRRLQGRRECPVCQRAYNPEGAPARDGRHCDDHPHAELRQRPDDGDQAVRRRFAEFRAKTAPLAEYYSAGGRLRPVSGTGTVDEVFENLRRAAGCGSPAGQAG
jgi:adenylate kinase